MADRKGTPDILGDILGGAMPAPPAVPEPPSSPEGSTATGPKPASSRSPKEVRTPLQMPPPKSAKPAGREAATDGTAAAGNEAARTRWTFTRVTFHDYGGWRARLRDGAELPGWKQGPGIDAYLAAMGAEGWELVGVVAGERSQWQAFFNLSLS